MTTMGPFIGGQETDSTCSFEVLDPSTGETLAEVARGGSVEIDAAIRAATDAATDWSRSPARERAQHLRAIATALQHNRDDLALLESQDTGKPLTQARADADVAARYFEFYANAVENFHGDSLPSMTGIVAYTRNEPYGVTGHIIPWNYPMQIACRTVAPALAVGNCAVVKPAEEAPLSVLRIARIAHDAGLPPGVLNVVPGYGEEAGAALATHDGVAHLSFTGSVEVGGIVASAAGANAIPVALELGGKSPNVVLADADLDTAIPVIAKSILQNAGQTCSAGSRLLVQRAVHEEVVARLASALGEVTIGPGPTDPDLGPLISSAQLARVTRMVEKAAGSGELRLGSVEPYGPDSNGYFFAPAILDNVDPQAPIAQEEVFGPVVAVLPFDTVEEAAQLANATAYGLIAAIWTSNIDHALRLAEDIRAGQVYINTYGAGGGVEFPFGGFKKSGFGREKGFEALRGFCGTKTVIVKLSN